MKIKELLGKSNKELKKIEEGIKKGIKESSNKEEKRILEKDLQQLNLANNILKIEGIKEVLLDGTSIKETLAKMKDEDVFFLASNTLSLQQEGEKEFNEAVIRLWKSAKEEKRIRKQFKNFLSEVQNHPFNEVYEQGWRVLKVNSIEGKRMITLLSKYERIMENKFKNESFLDVPPTAIEKFTQARQEILVLSKKFQGTLDQLLNPNKKRGT